MVGLGVVLSGMVAGRIFGTADVAAGETNPQAHPFAATCETFLAEGLCWGADSGDGVQVLAGRPGGCHEVDELLECGGVAVCLER
jgi:hypothetical protein